MGEYFIIGIGGVTNGGKTTLCKSLVEKFPDASTLNMDDYYWPDEDSRHIWLDEYSYADWEAVTSIDFERLVNDIKKWVLKVTGAQAKASAHPPLLFVEGILIFSNVTLMSLFHKQYFFTLAEDVCWERRKHRVYDPPEPDNYFKHVWSSYLNILEDSQQYRDIVYLDGSDKQLEISSRVHKDIRRMIEGTR